MPLLGSFTQQVGEVMDYYLDYDLWFSTRSDGPASLAVSAESGVVITGFAVDPATRKARVVIDSTASPDGIDSKVTVWLTTTTGIIKEDDFMIRVRET